MKTSPAARMVTAAFLLVAVVATVGYFLRRQETAVLATEIAVLRDQSRELAQLRAEHARLTATQIPTAELERLRNDRAAIVRLRSEIELLKDRAEKMARANETAGK